MANLKKSKLIRKGFLSIGFKHLRRLNFPWLFRQTTKYMAIRRAIRRNDGKADCGPVIGHFFCTSRCDQECPMCDIPSRKTDSDLDTSDALRIVDELAELGVSGISFTGGEPLLRPDIFDLMDRARKYGLDVILVTNGMNLKKYCRQIISAKPSVINVSIDGSCASLHDISRGRSGFFERTMEGIKSIKNLIDREGSDIQIVASTVISENNVNDLGKIIDLCKGIGIDRIIFCPLHEFKDSSCAIPPFHLNYDLQNFLIHHKDRALIDNSDRYLKRLNSLLDGGAPPTGCRAGYTTLIVDFEGKLYPCKWYFETKQIMADPVAEKRTLKEVWYSEEFNAFRKTCKDCRKCYLTINREFDTLFS